MFKKVKSPMSVLVLIIYLFTIYSFSYTKVYADAFFQDYNISAYRQKISHDKNYIYVVSNNCIKKINVETGNVTTLHTSSYTINSLVESPDGQWIYFSPDNASGICSLYKISSSGTNLTKLYDNVEFHDMMISPDGQWIYYVTSSDGFDLYRIKTDGSTKQLIQGGSGEVERYLLSPDGNYVVYIYAVDRLYSKNLTTWETGVISFNSGNAIIGISPNNKVYYYEGSSVYESSMKGENKNLVTSYTVSRISPDGEWLYGDNEGVIFKVRTDGTEYTELFDYTPGYFLILNNSDGFLDKEGNIFGRRVNDNNVFSIYRAILNSLPTINITTNDNQILSENLGYNTFSVSGTVHDLDNGDTIIVKYTLTNTETNTDITEHTNVEILTYTSNGSDKSFSYDINIDNTIPEGYYKLTVTAVDSLGEKAEAIKTVRVDKTSPEISEMNLDLTSNSITVNCTASDVEGLDESPYRYTIGSTTTDWLSNSSNTFSNLLPNKRYTIKTEVKDKVGNTSSYTKSIYTKAEIPNITINNPTSITLDLTIADNNPNNTAYQIINTSNNNYITALGEETTSPTWIIPDGKIIVINGLTPLTTYTYKVKAKNEEGVETILSSPASGTTLAPPPGMVPEVTATATSNEITLYWNPVADATSYEVEADNVIIDNGTNVSFTHTELLPDTEHTYRVRAKNGTVAGDWSDPISKSTLPLPPETPTNINTLSTGNTITLTWSAVGNATSYDIEVDGEIISNGNSTNYVHTGLLPYTTHGYKVRSINPAGKSQWSDEVIASTLEESLPTPTNITVNSGKTSIEISWDEIVGMQYQVEVDGNIVDNGINSVYTHSGLTPDTEHTYRVRSYKTGSYSDWSSLLTVNTKPDTFATPSNIESSATDTTITITWEEVTDADGYDVEVDGNIVDNGINTSFTHNGLQANSNHVYKIRAKQGETLSDWSEFINVTTYVLATPNNITVTTSETEILVNWDIVENATTYEVKVEDNLIKDITDTTYTVSGLFPGSQHKIQVRAINADGTSSYSLPITAITKASSNEAPQNITALTAKDQITLLWEPIEGAQSYDIEANGEVIPEISSNIYTHDNLDSNTSYTYKIRINKPEGAGEWSSPITIATMPVAPGIPENITVSSTIDSVLVSWDAAVNATEYEIETGGQIIDVGTSTNYLITGLTPNTEYSYKVRGKNQTSVGTWSDSITITTKSVIQNYTIQGNIDEEKNLILSAVKIKDWSNYTFTITYNPDEIEIIDICSQTSREDRSLGNIIGTDIEVTQNVPGTLQFKKLSQVPLGQTVSGIINSIKIKFKTDSQVSVTYTIQ